MEFSKWNLLQGIGLPPLPLLPSEKKYFFFAPFPNMFLLLFVLEKDALKRLMMLPTFFWYSLPTLGR